MPPSYDGPGALAGAAEAGVFIAGRQFTPNTIIASHSPPRQSAEALRRLRWQRYVESVHQLGAGVELNFWDEVARHHPDLVGDLERRLVRYAALDPDLLAALCADKFAPMPILVGAL